MGNGKRDLKGKAAVALRAAGFMPLPRWWVREDELQAIARIKEKHEEEVNEIRARATGKAHREEDWG